MASFHVRKFNKKYVMPERFVRTDVQTGTSQNDILVYTL